MSIECAFRSRHRDVLAVWDEYVEACRTAPAAWKAFRDEVAPNFEYLALDYRRGAQMVGLRVRDDGMGPGGDWRLAHWKQLDLWVPTKRTKAGKELHRRLEALPVIVLAAQKLPGMPHEVSVPTGKRDGTFWIKTPSVGRFGDHVYAGWGVEAERVEKAGTDDDLFWGRHGQRLDREMWEQIKLSEFYVALEAAESAKSCCGRHDPVIG